MSRAFFTAAVFLISTVFALAQKPVSASSLVPPVVSMAPGDAYSGKHRVFQGIPTIERTMNDRLWAAWFARSRSGTADSHVIVCVSDDEGATWSEPVLVIDPPGEVRAFDPCLWLDPDGKLWLFWAQSHGRWDGRGGVWCITSEDSQTRVPTWSPPRRLCDGVMLNKPTALKSSSLLLPVSVWDVPLLSRQPARRTDNLRQQSGANVFSLDAGLETPPVMIGQVIAPKREYDEHQIIELTDTRLWMLLRTPAGLFESTSTDGGRNWAGPNHSPIPHINSRFCLRRLQSGRLLLITHEPPDGKMRSHLIARLSEDEGKTWKGGLLLDERAGVSYPDATEGAKGVIHVIYDFERTRSKQILLASFTESHVLKSSPGRNGRLRALVNQASGVSSTDEELEK
jgi:predicted neuraminidase